MRRELLSRFYAPDVDGSLAARARQRRWTEVIRRFADLSEMRVLDLGGTPDAWLAAPVRPAHLTVVNVRTDLPPEPWVDVVTGDACTFRSHERFDLCFSSSTIEHVGGHDKRKQFAEAVRSAALRHWVQTPYRYFPIEPHWACPGLHFLPFRLRLAAAKRWPIGYFVQHDDQAMLEAVEEVELLTRTQMRSLFPDSELWMEKIVGLPKSIVAIRD